MIKSAIWRIDDRGGTGERIQAHFVGIDDFSRPLLQPEPGKRNG